MDHRLLFSAAMLAVIAIAAMAISKPEDHRSAQVQTAIESRESGSNAAPSTTPALPMPGIPRPESVAPAFETSPESTASPANDTSRPADAGMVVGIDPETGRLGPATPEQRARLGIDDAMPTNQHFAKTRNADGSLTIHTQGRLREFFVVKMGPDGKPVVGCVDGPDAAKRALSNHAPAAQEER